MIDVTIIGTMPEVAYNSDSKVFWTGGAAPTLRAEAHGHLPNILIDDERRNNIQGEVYSGVVGTLLRDEQ